MDYIKKYQKGSWLNRRIYNAIDPTSDYPNFLDAIGHGTNLTLGIKVKKEHEPVSDAAWRKRLGLEYNKDLLIKNPDGSFRLPPKYEKQILTDTTAVKKRIQDAIDVYGSEEILKKYDANRENWLRIDRGYLDKLRKMFKGEPIVVNEFEAWKDRKTDNDAISPLNVMKNFTITHDPKTNQEHYSDTYDFNEFEKIVPGKPFEIKGIVKKQSGGNLTPQEKLKQYYKNQANKGRQAVTQGRDKFAKDYMLPAAKAASSFTPVGPIIGLMDAKEAYDKGDIGWAMFGAGMEVLPYVGKGVVKGIKVLKNVPGIGKDAPELGYHALNKNHWALNPRKLYNERANHNLIDESAVIDVATLYALAAGNRTINLLKKTPLNNIIKNKAERIMRLSENSSRSPIEILKTKKKIYSYKGSWADDFIADGTLGSKFSEQERDLVNLYLRGNASGFEEISNSMKTMNFGERYNKLYPNAKYFVMQSQIPNNVPISLTEMYNKGTHNTEFIKEAIKNKKIGNKSFSDASYVEPIDDIAGHQIQVRGDLEKPILITQDLWKFNPKDYPKRWSFNKNSLFKSNTKYSELLHQKQAGLLDKIGNPFYLVQNNPIVE